MEDASWSVISHVEPNWQDRATVANIIAIKGIGDPLERWAPFLKLIPNVTKDHLDRIGNAIVHPGKSALTQAIASVAFNILLGPFGPAVSEYAAESLFITATSYQEAQGYIRIIKSLIAEWETILQTNDLDAICTAHDCEAPKNLEKTLHAAWAAVCLGEPSDILTRST